MSTVELGEDLGIESSTELKNRLAPLVAQRAAVVVVLLRDRYLIMFFICSQTISEGVNT